MFDLASERCWERLSSDLVSGQDEESDSGRNGVGRSSATFYEIPRSSLLPFAEMREPSPSEVGH